MFGLVFNFYDLFPVLGVDVQQAQSRKWSALYFRKAKRPMCTQ